MNSRTEEKSGGNEQIAHFLNGNFFHVVEALLILYGLYLCLYPALRNEGTAYILLILVSFPVSIPYFAISQAWTGVWLPVALIFVFPIVMAALRSSLSE